MLGRLSTATVLVLVIVADRNTPVTACRSPGWNEFATEVCDIAKAAVLDKVKHQLAVAGGAVTAFKEKNRPIIITAINNRDNDFRLTGIHFESGKAFAHPPVHSILR
jgi:hypothetical protein